MAETSEKPRAQRRDGLALLLAVLACTSLAALTRPRLRRDSAATPDASRIHREVEPRPSPLDTSRPSAVPSGQRDPLAKAAARVAADVGAAAEENAAPASTEQEPGTVRLAVRVHLQRQAVPAQLELSLPGRAAPALHTVPASGTLALQLAPGRVRLVAWSETALARPLEIELTGNLELELELEPTLPVEGRIVAERDGTPVADAEVVFWTAAELDVVRTDAEGRFRHPRFPAGGPAQQIRVCARGFGSTVRYLKLDTEGAWKLAAALEGEASLSGHGTPFLELALVPELVVRGRVLAADGTPLAGARIAAEGYFHARPSIAVRDLVETCSDAAGEFELAGLRADIGHELVVTAEGHATLAHELAPAERHELGDLSLAPEAVLAGLVVDPDGLPLANAEVVLALEPAHAADAAAPLDAAARVLARERRTRTDANGAFSFVGLAPVPLLVRATTDDGLEVETELSPDGRGLFPPTCLQVAALARR